MTDFLSQLKQGLEVKQDCYRDYPVLAEINIRSTELHKIANGDCCTLSDGALGIRFLLKNSFKVRQSNFVVNEFVMQIVALGKDNVMHKESIAVKTKVQQVIKEKIVAPKKETKDATQVRLGKEESY